MKLKEDKNNITYPYKGYTISYPKEDGCGVKVYKGGKFIQEFDEEEYAEEYIDELENDSVEESFNSSSATQVSNVSSGKRCSIDLFPKVTKRKRVKEDVNKSLGATEIVRQMYDKFPEVDFVDEDYLNGDSDKVVLYFDLSNGNRLDIEDFLNSINADFKMFNGSIRVIAPEDGCIELN